MKTSILTTAAALSDQDLLARLTLLAGHERDATVELVAHLAALDTRPILYAAGGHGSLFSYCTQALRLSEDAACNRIEAARACRRFPGILDLLASGGLSLASVRLLGRHLTAENHRTVLARAENRSRREIEALVAELAPRPDVPGGVRKLPGPVLAAPMPTTSRQDTSSLPATGRAADPAPRSLPRPVILMTAPERYRVQFTIGAETQDKLRRLQALLRREIPDGDPGLIFDRAIDVLLEKVERAKVGRAARPRPPRAIRPGADSDAPEGTLPPRDPPRAVKRAVWARDGGRCAFVSPEGRRCGERAFLEFHHLRPYAQRGEATVENIALRCRRHNQYEADLAFGPRGTPSRATRNQDPNADLRRDPASVHSRTATELRASPVRAGGTAGLDTDPTPRPSGSP
jgi:hypothetical protein